MESIEDDVVLKISEEPPSPIPKPKLRRLKKSSSSATSDSIRGSDDRTAPDQNPSSPTASESRDAERENDFDKGLDPPLSAPSDEPAVPESDSPILLPKDVGSEKEFDDDLDPLFSVPAVNEGFETLDTETERGEEDGEDGGLKKIGENGSGTENLKSARKRLNLEEGSEEISTKRKKKSKSADKSGEKPKPKESIREKKRAEKERIAQLEKIHAESQRLLRETRDASFKPVPVIQKPISSILEKIRIRKMEVLKQTSFLCPSDSVSASDRLVDETTQKNCDQVNIRNDSTDNAKNTEVDGFASVQAVASCGCPPHSHGEIPCNNASNLESKDVSPTLPGEAQEATKILQSNHEEESSKQLADSEESSNPPLPTSDSNSVPDDLSSEEEDNDKENIDPRTTAAVTMDSSPEHGLARAFLDDEAEEEDDSDHDLGRFQDNEEDDESDEDEVFNDLIATGYKEAPIDHEKRNQLHQKWLEQQDAAGTDDMLERLRYGQKQREPTCLVDDDDDIDNDDSDEDFADEKSQDPPLMDDARQNSKKAKQMMAQMFTDADDPYLPSDDEESEQTLLRQRLLMESAESSFISPVEDDHSREVSGLIKKLNVAPVTKKRARTISSSFDSLVMGSNSNSTSKLSFLNRSTSTSLPSLSKQASTTVRAFIFGRDDSNSKSGISTSDNISDMDPKENHSSKPATSKVSSTQFKSAAMTKIESNTGSASSSLFQILRHSSMQFDQQFIKSKSNCQEITETQAVHQFSAFKLRKRASKVESRI